MNKGMNEKWEGERVEGRESQSDKKKREMRVREKAEEEESRRKEKWVFNVVSNGSLWPYCGAASLCVWVSVCKLDCKYITL